MNPNNFVEFLRNLGFAELSNISSVFSYEVSFGENTEKEVRYVYTPTEEDIFIEHRKLWNRNDADDFVAVGDNQTHIIDVKVKPNQEKPLASKIKSFDYGVNTQGFEKEKVKQITKDFVDSAYFFDFVAKNKKKPQKVDEDLLRNLVALRDDLIGIRNDEDTIHLLILRCLFIKYLEDKGIFDQDFLLEAISSGEPSKLIQKFEEIKKINGDIFKDDQILENQIDIGYLEKLLQFFTSDYRRGQGRLFPYLFDQIPIQLISSVYETFLNHDKRQGKGIYYTPSFLVNFILSHSLEEKLKENRNLTIFDPAVGSGAFLVESFKKIAKDGDSYERKKSILEKQLFGVDIDANALQIAAFSLYLALIETVEPEFIRKQIEISNPILPSLIGKTLIQANTITDEVFEGKTFDCIVSNPPWGAVRPPNHNEKLNLENKKEREAIETREEYKYVSNYERSQAFLARVKKWSNKNTTCSMIVKNSIFLNNDNNPFSKQNKPKEFRKELLTNYEFSNFYELSSFDKIFFHQAVEPSVVLVFRLADSLNNKIKYISPSLNSFSESFQIIHYTQKDIKEVEQSRFIEDDLLWRILINGDFEDFKLIEKIRNQKMDVDILCSREFEPKKQDKSILPPKYRTYIESSDFERYRINSLSKFDWNLPRRRNGNELLFQTGGKILIAYRPKPTDNLKLRGVYTELDIVYRDDIIGFKVANVEEQMAYTGIINSSLAGYFFVNISSQWAGGLKRDSIRLFDIQQFPFPNLNNSYVKKAIQPITKCVNKIQKLKEEDKETKDVERELDEIIFDFYGLKEYEKEIIREFYQIKVERAENKVVGKSDIENYAEKFAEVFGLMLEGDSKLVATKFHISENLGAIICFTIVNKNDDISLVEDKTLEILNFVKKQQITQADATKILNEDKVKIYDEKLMYIVKSNLFKDWTIRQAIKDAREEIHLLLAALPETNE